MKKSLLLTLLISGTASAAPLYTVNIKVTPAQPDASILFYNNAKNAPKDAACSNINTRKPFIVCKLPRGTYTLAIFSDENSFKSVYRTNVVINKNTVLNVPLTLKPPKPALPAEAVAAFNHLAIKVTGEVEECGKTIPQPDRKCAITNIDPELVKRWANLIEEMEQTEPWTRAGNLSFATFDVAGKPYSLILSKTEDGGTLMQWQRNF